MAEWKVQGNEYKAKVLINFLNDCESVNITPKSPISKSENYLRIHSGIHYGESRGFSFQLPKKWRLGDFFERPTSNWFGIEHYLRTLDRKKISLPYFRGLDKVPKAFLSRKHLLDNNPKNSNTFSGILTQNPELFNNDFMRQKIPNSTAELLRLETSFTNLTGGCEYSGTYVFDGFRTYRSSIKNIGIKINERIKLSKDFMSNFPYDIIQANLRGPEDLILEQMTIKDKEKCLYELEGSAGFIRIRKTTDGKSCYKPSTPSELLKLETLAQWFLDNQVRKTVRPSSGRKKPADADKTTT